MSEMVAAPDGNPGEIRETTPGEELVRAILEHRTVRFTYHGLERIVEPRVLGLHEAGEAVLVAYQTAGFSRSGELPGWRTFILAEIYGLEVREAHFSPPEPDSRRSTERMVEIFARA